MVVNTILKRIKELVGDDTKSYKNFLEKITILSTNRDLETNVKKGAEMLAVDIEKIPFYQDGKMVGIREGIEQGLQRGFQKGIFETAIKMIERFNLSVDDVIKELNLKKEELLEYMKKNQK